MTQRLFFLIMIGWAIGCSPAVTVHSDTPYPGDFDRYASFKFYNPKNLPPSNFAFSEEHKKALFDAVADQMKMRGYKSIRDADLLIRIQGSASNTIDIREGNSYYPYDPYGYPYSYSPYGSYPYRYGNLRRDMSKKEVTIIIDMIDISKDKVVWQGVATQSIGKNEEISASVITDLVVQIFSKYPYKAPSAN